jgi:hypothetical protein
MSLSAFRVKAYLLAIMDSHQKSIMANYHHFLLFFTIAINTRDVHFFSYLLLSLVLYKLYVIAVSLVAFSLITLGFVSFAFISTLHFQEM